MLIAVSIFQLSFTFIKNSYVKRAEKYAQSATMGQEEGLVKAMNFNKAKTNT
ncbi:MAG: hypothetical protein LRY27_02005 [Chitinophagales bacterium]|nr:hypothetical protein [Chitinophagales bacterium]